MRLSCGECGSEDFTKTSFVYEQGVVHGHSTSSGMALGYVGGRVGIGYGAGTARTTEVSSTALRAAPPERRTTPFVFYLLILFGTVFSLGAFALGCYLLASSFEQGMSAIFQAALLAGLMVYLPIRSMVIDFKFNRTVLPRLYDKWLQSFMCNRCGAIQQPPE